MHDIAYRLHRFHIFYEFCSIEDTILTYPFEWQEKQQQHRLSCCDNGTQSMCVCWGSMQHKLVATYLKMVYFLKKAYKIHGSQWENHQKISL